MAWVDTLIELEKNEPIGSRHLSLLALKLARCWHRNPLIKEGILAK